MSQNSWMIEKLKVCSWSRKALLQCLLVAINVIFCSSFAWSSLLDPQGPLGVGMWLNNPFRNTGLHPPALPKKKLDAAGDVDLQMNPSALTSCSCASRIQLGFCHMTSRGALQCGIEWNGWSLGSCCTHPISCQLPPMGPGWVEVLSV